jgi:hypothetical protein
MHMVLIGFGGNQWKIEIQMEIAHQAFSHGFYYSADVALIVMAGRHQDWMLCDAVGIPKEN